MTITEAKNIVAAKYHCDNRHYTSWEDMLKRLPLYNQLQRERVVGLWFDEAAQLMSDTNNAELKKEVEELKERMAELENVIMDNWAIDFGYWLILNNAVAVKGHPNISADLYKMDGKDYSVTEIFEIFKEKITGIPKEKRTLLNP